MENFWMWLEFATALLLDEGLRALYRFFRALFWFF